MRISELAETAGVPASTVRYYERVGLLEPPSRTAGGYRDYDDAAAARLLFIARGRRMGLSCEQITSLVSIWAGADCQAAHDRVLRLVEEKRAEIVARIRELQQFDADLAAVRTELESQPPQDVCRPDLSCCVPASAGAPVVLELTPRQAVAVRAALT